MPKGALVVLKTRNASRYEKGYPVTNVQGIVLGTVHAIDHIQNLLVVNISRAEDEGKSLNSSSNLMEVDAKKQSAAKNENIHSQNQQDEVSEDVHPFEVNEI